MTSSPFVITEHIIDCQHIREYPHATRHGDDVLKLVVKQYTPKSNPDPQPGDVTIIGAHASGMPKELYEPLWEETLAKLEHQGVRIRSIWIADTASQAASGLLNRPHLGNDPSWFDHARDLLHLINTFKADMPRPIVGVGHSLGAGQLILLSFLHPRLLTTLILIDPVLAPDVHTGKGAAFAHASLATPDHWGSRASAAAFLSKQYRRWDPRVLNLFLKHGLHHIEGDSSSDGAVVLTTSRHQEVMQYLRANFAHHTPLETDPEDAPRPHDAVFFPDVIGPAHAVAPFYRNEPILAMKTLGHLRPSVLYVFGGRSPVSTPQMRAEKVERTGRGVGGSGGFERGRVREVVLDNAGHQVPFEDVGGVAHATAEWLGGEVVRWKEEEERINRDWMERSVAERVALSKEWPERLRQVSRKAQGIKSKL
ncbi:alpha/beta-hydrolase [Aspergillus saccharolyticus JOP 1030-1]|uniref:Alpha/beta-hydrolase n=1 Tax=Aspergillus saccharolyticus JOP 1030-1 TaxID=1450539 RepID=A0A318ZHX1_9EURO|nr:alpha/beta-hydrolase [Aspergillus saccharolyticus JOP 1030-1]PYH45984.1 alpha/beta-hydrolase [Aspergillus saccharolyticus JOP 1030-1]